MQKESPPEEAYEVWHVANHPEYGGQWTWYILKKYQTPEKEATNDYARWFCYVTSPYSPNGDWGDTYIQTIKETGAVQLNFNPLKKTSVLCNQCHEALTEQELAVYPLQWQHSGDMYCMQHRVCPDDCRHTPCLLTDTDNQTGGRDEAHQT